MILIKKEDHEAVVQLIAQDRHFRPGDIEIEDDPREADKSRIVCDYSSDEDFLTLALTSAGIPHQLIFR